MWLILLDPGLRRDDMLLPGGYQRLRLTERHIWKLG